MVQTIGATRPSPAPNDGLASLSIARDDVARLALLLDDMGTTLGAEQTAANDLLARAGGLVAHMLGSGEAALRDANGGMAPWQVRRIRAHVDENLHARLPIRELAQMVRLSCSYFSRAFKVSFGCSPHAYVLQRRIARAKALLQGGDEPLVEIAQNCGFSDQAHLSRTFRQQIGCTPSAWRRTMRR